MEASAAEQPLSVILRSAFWPASNRVSVREACVYLGAFELPFFFLHLAAILPRPRSSLVTRQNGY